MTEEIFISTLNGYEIRTVRHNNESWLLLRDILLACGYTPLTAQGRISDMCARLPKRCCAQLKVKLGARAVANTFVSQEGVNLIMSGQSYRKKMAMPELKLGTPATDEDTTAAIAREEAESVLNKVLANPDIYIALLLGKYSSAQAALKTAEQQKQEALDNIMKIIEAA